VFHAERPNHNPHHPQNPSPERRRGANPEPHGPEPAQGQVLPWQNASKGSTNSTPVEKPLQIRTFFYKTNPILRPAPPDPRFFAQIAGYLSTNCPKPAKTRQNSSKKRQNLRIFVQIAPKLQNPQNRPNPFSCNALRKSMPPAGNPKRTQANPTEPNPNPIAQTPKKRP